MNARRRRSTFAATAWARSAVVAWLALAGPGCVFGDLDLSEKTCSTDEPCPGGWTCSGGRCVKSDSPCAFRPSNVRIAWTTPQSIRWEWDAPENTGGTYRLRIGEGVGPEDGGQVRLITGSENPELGRAVIPRVEGDVRVESTISREHTPNTLYWGQLEAVDNEGCTWASPVLGATTALAPPSDQAALPIFVDDFVDWHSPDAAVLAAGAGSYGGSAHIAWDVPETDGENLQLGGLGISLGDVGGDGSAVQSSAYVELAVSFEAQSPSFYTRVLLQRPPDGTGIHSRLEGFTLPADGQYHLVQIPIHALVPDDGHLLDGSDAVEKFMFGCSPFEADTHLRVDEVYIRW